MTDFHRDEDLAEAVAMLLTSRNEYVPGPPPLRWTKSAPVGPQASRFKPCEECGGVGRLRGAKPCHTCREWKQDEEHAAKTPKDSEARQRLAADVRKRGGRPRRPNHGCRICMACDGTGLRKLSRKEWRAGEEDRTLRHDLYSGLTMAELDDALREAQTKARAELKARLAEERSGGYGWERDRERMARDGSYADLERALERLPAGRREQILAWAERGGHDAEGRALNGLPCRWSDEARLAIRGTLELLAAGMARPVRVPGWVVRAWRARERSVA